MQAEEDGTLGLPPIKISGEGGSCLNYFLQAVDAFCPVIMDRDTIHQKITEWGRENIKLQDVQRQWVAEKCFGTLVSSFMDLHRMASITDLTT